MSFYDRVSEFRDFDIAGFCTKTDAHDVERALNRSSLSDKDFLILLSEQADRFLEPMAQTAAACTRRHFGNAVILFTPMYISNYCENVCPYCSFARQHGIIRSHLSRAEIEAEAKRISESGIRHLLLLTGEAPSMVPVSYLEKVITLLRGYFSSVTIEIYPLSAKDYARLITAGADGLTLYQETYVQPRYEQLHRGGPKADYRFRLDAPERACMNGMRTVTVGALYGLADWRTDAFMTALHAAYLQAKYPSVEIGVSFPRIRPQAGSFAPRHCITDRQFVRLLTALRLFLPTAGITLSTRESAAFRMAVLPIGVTRMSAGVSTSVGGHSGNESTPQFEIADSRDVATIKSDLLEAGFQPVTHDWNHVLTA